MLYLLFSLLDLNFDGNLILLPLYITAVVLLLVLLYSLFSGSHHFIESPLDVTNGQLEIKCQALNYSKNQTHTL